MYMQNFCVHAVAVVGLEETFYQIPEEVAIVEVCAIVYEPDSTVSCPITFSFNVRLSTSDFTAGIFPIMINYTHPL